ncbi:hypothetical protein F4776DRAFT_387239 [Hypoxylon sp. NC0597]|nr:hypothetical protein F4776DRAFT_387239 [Hypoxylon sp. NC0597]
MSPIQHQRASSETEATQTMHEKDSVSQVREVEKSSQASPEALVSKSEGKTKQQVEKDTRLRDHVTGRILAEDGGSCIRCIEKGLRCTLNFFGLEGEEKCAACRRSNTKYCIRQFGIDRRIRFIGDPWKDPNYFTIGDQPSPEEMEEILQEHHLGKQMYVDGMYLYEADMKRMALPPYNGSDLPIGDRSENWRTASWKNVLPIWKNRSRHPRPVQMRPLHILKDDANTPTTARSQPGPSGFVSEDTVKYLRVTRKYQPREAHMRERMNDALGETW